MSEAPSGLAAARSTSEQVLVVSKSGKCKREVKIGKKTHVIWHRWRPAQNQQVLLETRLHDRKNKNRTTNKRSSYVANSEEALSSRAREMSEDILKKRQDMHLKAQAQNGGGGSSTGTMRRNADTELPDPVIIALRGTGRARSGAATNQQPEQHEEVKVDWRKESVDRFLATMDDMGTANGLKFMKEQGSKLATDVQRQIRDLKVKAELGMALERAIKVAQQQNKTSEGHRTWQTLMTAAACPLRVNQQGEEDEDAEGEPRSISGKRKAAAIGATERA